VRLALAGCPKSKEIQNEEAKAYTSYGFQPGTTDFAKCLQREDFARRL